MTQSLLFGLPREIHDEIYAFCFDEKQINYDESWLRPQRIEHESEISEHEFPFPSSWDDDHDMEDFWHPLPSLCLVSRQVFEESVPQYLKIVDLQTHSMAKTQKVITYLTSSLERVRFALSSDTKLVDRPACVRRIVTSL